MPNAPLKNSVTRREGGSQCGVNREGKARGSLEMGSVTRLLREKQGSWRQGSSSDHERLGG